MSRKTDYKELKLQIRILKEIGCYYQYIEARKKCGYIRIFNPSYKDLPMYKFIDSSLTWGWTNTHELWNNLYYACFAFFGELKNYNEMLLNDQEKMNKLKSVVSKFFNTHERMLY